MIRLRAGNLQRSGARAGRQLGRSRARSRRSGGRGRGATARVDHVGTAGEHGDRRHLRSASAPRVRGGVDPQRQAADHGEPGSGERRGPARGRPRCRTARRSRLPTTVTAGSRRQRGQALRRRPVQNSGRGGSASCVSGCRVAVECGRAPRRRPSSSARPGAIGIEALDEPPRPRARACRATALDQLALVRAENAARRLSRGRSSSPAIRGASRATRWPRRRQAWQQRSLMPPPAVGTPGGSRAPRRRRRAIDAVAPVQVGDRAREAEHPVVAARRQRVRR